VTDGPIPDALRAAGLEVPDDLVPGVLANCRALLDSVALVRAAVDRLAADLEPAATFWPPGAQLRANR